MNWQSLLKDFKNFLKFERNLSDNTIESYGLDILKLINHSKENKLSLKVNSIKNSDIREFIFQQSKQLSSNSQSRLISSLKKFFDYLIIEKIIKYDGKCSKKLISSFCKYIDISKLLLVSFLIVRARLQIDKLE
mgnify:CR=1 FL=1